MLAAKSAEVTGDCRQAPPAAVAKQQNGQLIILSIYPVVASTFLACSQLRPAVRGIGVKILRGGPLQTAPQAFIFLAKFRPPPTRRMPRGAAPLARRDGLQRGLTCLPGKPVVNLGKQNARARGWSRRGPVTDRQVTHC